MDRLDTMLAVEEPPGPAEITGALWSACHAGRPEAAEYLLARGADTNWIGWDGSPRSMWRGRKGTSSSSSGCRPTAASGPASVQASPSGAGEAVRSNTRDSGHTVERLHRVDPAATIGTGDLHTDQQRSNPARNCTRRHHGPGGALRVMRSITR